MIKEDGIRLRSGVSSGGVRRSVAQYVQDAWWNRYRKQSVRSILFPIFIVSHNVTYTTYKTTIFIKKPGNNRGTLSSFLLCSLPLLKTLYDVFKCVLRHFSFLVIFPCHSCSRSQLELIKDRFPQRISLETSSRMTEKTHFSYRVDFIIYGLFKALFDAFKCVLRGVSLWSGILVPPLCHLFEEVSHCLIPGYHILSWVLLG